MIKLKYQAAYDLGFTQGKEAFYNGLPIPPVCNGLFMNFCFKVWCPSEKQHDERCAMMKGYGDGWLKEQIKEPTL